MTGDDSDTPGANVVDFEAAAKERAREMVAELFDKVTKKGKGGGGGDGTNPPKPPTRGVRAIVSDLLEACKLITDDQGVVHMYGGGAWSPMSEQRLLAMAHRMKLGMSASMRRDVVAYLKAETYVEDLTWGRVGEHEIPCANGVLNVRTWALRPHTPDDLLDRVLPIAWDRNAKCERWEQALGLVFPPAVDGGRIGALQEFFGYVCLAHAKYKKALFLFGKRDTGKSLAALLLKKLVGEKYCCTIGVEHMDDPQRLALIKGKALNVITEVSSDALIADGGFKTLVSTEEPVLIDAKYRPPETLTPTTKHAIVGNTLPKLNDQTDATFERLLIIPYDRVLTDAEQDRGILTELIKELPGLLVWAAKGAKRLVERGGQWPDVPAARAVLEEYREDLNPVRQFVTEMMRGEAGAIVPLSRFAAAFNRWNTGNRHYSVKYVGKMLRAGGYENDIKVAKHEGRVVTVLKGWRLVGEAPAHLYIKAAPTNADDVLEATELQPGTAAVAPAKPKGSPGQRASKGAHAAADMDADVAAARGEDYEETVP